MRRLAPNATPWSCLAGVLACVCVGACADGDSVPNHGALGIALTLPGGAVLAEVTAEVTGNGITPITMVIDVSSLDATVSAQVGTLPVGDGYLVVLTATTDVGGSCIASTMFDVVADMTTTVSLTMQCMAPPGQNGTVIIDTDVNVCPRITTITVAPGEVVDGDDIALHAVAQDPNMDPLTYQWDATAGSFGDDTAATTTYTCSPVGVHTLTLTVDDGAGCTKDLDFDVTCIPVNQPPVAVADMHPSGAHHRLSANVLLGDSDPDSWPQPLSVVSTGTFASSAGGSVTMMADGSFTYDPPLLFVGVDTFTYTITDGTDFDSALVTVNVQAPITWFVDASAPGGGTGREVDPIRLLPDVTPVSSPGHRIEVAPGSYTRAVLQSAQTLVGDPSDPPQLTGVGGTPLVLAGNVTVSDFEIIGGATGVSGAGLTGNVTLDNLAISGVTGLAVSLATSPSATVVFDGIQITTAGTVAITASQIGRIEVRNGTIDAVGATQAIRLDTSAGVEALIEQIGFGAGAATRDVQAVVSGSGTLDLELDSVSFGGTQYGLFAQGATTAAIELDIHDTDNVAAQSAATVSVTTLAGWAGTVDMRMTANVWGATSLVTTAVTADFRGSGLVRALASANVATSGQRTFVLQSRNTVQMNATFNLNTLRGGSAAAQEVSSIIASNTSQVCTDWQSNQETAVSPTATTYRFTSAGTATTVMPGFTTNAATTLAAHGNTSIGGSVATTGTYSAGPATCVAPIID